MPAHATSSPSLPVPLLRLFVGALLLAFVATVVGPAASPVAARDYSRQISSTRASQLAYESAMRAADSQVKTLKRARKQTKRKLKKAERTLQAAVARRRRAKRRLGELRVQAQEARAALAAAVDEPPPPPDAASAILVLQSVRSDGLSLVSTPSLPELEDMGLLDGVTMPVVASGVSKPLRAVSPAAVVALEKQVQKQKRSYKKAKQRTRRGWRHVRVIRQRSAVLKQSERAAIARREYAERALGYRILSMSTLARKRLSKKTTARSLSDAGFVWPARGRISQGYGCTGFYLNPPRGSCRHFHDGIDIVSYRGAPIRSSSVGVISYVGWNPWDQHGRAFMIVVAHPGGYETLYGHVLPTRRVRVGQIVSKGEVIGYMGNTGRSTGTHLHFELRRGRTTLNPLSFL